MAKAPPEKSEPHHRDSPKAEPIVVEAPPQETAALAQPGPDEPPPTPAQREIPVPAVFTVNEPHKLTKGQIGGLCAEGLEAYMFGQRTRHDAVGRLWNMRREAVNDCWQLVITVSIGGYWLAEGALPLDRLPSAEGEHQLIALIEGMAGTVERAHRDIWAEQQKQLSGRSTSAAEDDAEAKKAGRHERA